MVLNHWSFGRYEDSVLRLGLDHCSLLSLASPDEPCCQAADTFEAPRRLAQQASMNLDGSEASACPQRSYSHSNLVSPNKTRALFLGHVIPGNASVLL